MSASILMLKVMLAGVFAIAAASKASSPRQLTALGSLVQTVTGRGARAGKVSALVLLVAEATVALLLVVGDARPAFAASIVLLAVLTAGLGVAVDRHADQPCRCFGLSTSPVGARHVVRNVLLMAAAFVGWLLAGSDDTRLLAVGPVVLATTAGLVLAALIVLFEDLTAVFGARAPRPGLVADSPVR